LQFSLAAALERLRLRNLVVDEKLSPGETLEGATSLFEGCTPLGPNGELTEEWCVQRLQPLFLHSPTVRTRTNTMSLFGWTRSEAPAALPAGERRWVALPCFVCLPVLLDAEAVMVCWV
jgi:hypothetical protein